MDRPPIEMVVREPTGLELGTFDVFAIRQRIYEGELHARCEYRAADGGWRPLADHPAFAEVLWLTGRDGEVDRSRRRSRFAGWRNSAAESAPGERVRIEQRGTSGRHGKPGVFGRVFGKKD